MTLDELCQEVLELDKKATNGLERGECWNAEGILKMSVLLAKACQRMKEALETINNEVTPKGKKK